MQTNTFFLFYINSLTVAVRQSCNLCYERRILLLKYYNLVQVSRINQLSVMSIVECQSVFAGLHRFKAVEWQKQVLPAKTISDLNYYVTTLLRKIRVSSNAKLTINSFPWHDFLVWQVPNISPRLLVNCETLPWERSQILSHFQVFQVAQTPCVQRVQKNRQSSNVCDVFFLTHDAGKK